MDKENEKMLNEHRLSATLALVAVLAAGPLSAGNIWLPGIEGVSNVAAASIKEKKFHQVVRQQYDFSCGSAALATLLTYHYEKRTDEQTAFDFMYEVGDKEKIAKAGFSLLDMKNYLEGNGFEADGYRASLDTLSEAGVPAIALINFRGYRHFVVIKGLADSEVLVGDPALGIKTMPRNKFESMWDNGILFIVRNKSEIGQKHFNSNSEWSALARAPLGQALSEGNLSVLTATLPRIGDF